MSKLLEEASEKGEKYSPGLQAIMDEQKKSNEEFKTFIKKEVRPLVKEMRKKRDKDAKQAEKFLENALHSLR